MLKKERERERKKNKNSLFNKPSNASQACSFLGDWVTAKYCEFAHSLRNLGIALLSMNIVLTWNALIINFPINLHHILIVL